MKKVLKNKKGFTLIEIIAVLVIIGILAAVAIPKFFSLQADAERKSLQVAMNDMKARSAMTFSKSMLANNGTPTAGDQDTWTDLGFAAVGDITAAYQDFAGTWARTSDTVITYDGVYTTDTTFTLTPGTATAPASIAASPTL